MENFFDLPKQYKLVAPNDSILRSPTYPATESDLKTIESLSVEMFKIMYETKGVGLAAPQIGIPISLFVMNQTGSVFQVIHEKVIINPEIIHYHERTMIEQERCLSLPKVSAYIERPHKIVCRYMNIKGEIKKFTYSGITARIFQHEYDHLQGILIIDRMKKSDLDQNSEKLNELKLTPLTEVPPYTRVK